MLLLAFRGFVFASSDMVEVINYSKHMIHSDLFSNDFYVSNISKVLPNERVVFSSVLKMLIGNFKYSIFAVHFLLTITMLIGLYLISSIYIKQKVFRWLTILILFGPLYKINLGGNELYYNMLISSFVAKVFGVWAFYSYLSSKKAIAIILILIATIIHPTVGSQLFIIVVLVMIFNYTYRGKGSLGAQEILSIVLYLAIGGGYIFYLLRAVHDFGIDKGLYFDIFEFRVPHHFFPQYFPLKSYIIEIILYSVGGFFMVKSKMTEMLTISLTIVIGIFIYIIGIFVFKMPFVLNTQWFKATIWLELFSLIAIVASIDKAIVLSEILNQVAFTLIIGLCIFVWILIVAGNSYFSQKPYQFCQNNDLYEEEKLGNLVREATKKDDIFVWPIDFSGFKFYSERGAFVDYKSVVHRGSVLREWYKRIKLIYGIDINTRRENGGVKQKAIAFYKNMGIDDIKVFKSKGIDYIVQYADVRLNLKILLKTKSYIVYNLK